MFFFFLQALFLQWSDADVYSCLPAFLLVCLFVFSSCGNYLFFSFKSVFMIEHQQNLGVSVFMCVCVFLMVLSAALFCPLTDVCVCVRVYRCWLLRCLLLDDVLKIEGKKKKTDLARV